MKRKHLPSAFRKPQQFLEQNGVAGEIIIGDNGSTDGSLPSRSRLGRGW
jgi:hypothetical protein